MFEGRRGSSWAGDIALDDISMQDGQCPTQLQCSFEDPKLCGWKNIHGDNFDWTRANGYTASIGTGPPFDHTTGTANGRRQSLTLAETIKEPCQAFLTCSSRLNVPNRQPPKRKARVH